MLKIKYTQNWNGKLLSDFHTTIRAAKECYTVGTVVEELLNDVPLSKSRIIQRRDFTLDEITNTVALLDTGYSKAEAVAVLRKMNHEWLTQHGENAPFCYLMLQVEERYINTFETLIRTAARRFDKLLPVIAQTSL